MTDPTVASSGVLTITAPGYRSLYRRFRPQRFAEVRGQPHVTTALRNAVREGRVSHAYLFSGPRGTGKTSTARILAKALNCEQLHDGEPCGGCGSCQAIAGGASFDVHELDAASNNGVDAMRDLVARASLATPGRWKVYIVDEVHMLSTAASNALLKTLEEPPSHVVFVLATTDPQKVLPTIRSRTQHYEFHLLPEPVLADLLAEVAGTAALCLPEGGLEAALRRGRGSARDALSALDQVAAAGVVDQDRDAIVAIISALERRDISQALTALEQALREGRDPHGLTLDLIERLRVGFLCLVAPGLDGLDASRDEAGEAQMFGTARLVRAMEVLGAAGVVMRDAPEPRVVLELALIRLTSPEADESPAALVERVERLERRLAAVEAAGQGLTSVSTPAAARAAPPVVSPPAQGTPPSAPAAGARRALGAFRREATSPPATPAVPTLSAVPPEVSQPSLERPPERAQPVPLPAPTRDELVTAWGDHVLSALRPKVRAVYQAGRFVQSDDGAAVIAVPNAAHLVHAEPLRDEVAQALSRHFGRRVDLRLISEESLETTAAATSRRASDVRASGTRSGTSSLVSASGVDEETEDVELAETTERLDVPADSTSMAEESLRRAFPGVEEVER